MDPNATLDTTTLGSPRSGKLKRGPADFTRTVTRQILLAAATSREVRGDPVQIKFDPIEFSGGKPLCVTQEGEKTTCPGTVTRRQSTAHAEFL